MGSSDSSGSSGMSMAEVEGIIEFCSSPSPKRRVMTSAMQFLSPLPEFCSPPPVTFTDVTNIHQDDTCMQAIKPSMDDVFDWQPSPSYPPNDDAARQFPWVSVPMHKADPGHAPFQSSAPAKAEWDDLNYDPRALVEVPEHWFKSLLNST